MSVVLSLGTALPAYAYAQSALLNYMQATLDLPEALTHKLGRLYARSGIATRYSVLPDFGRAGEGLFADPTSPASLQARMAIYHREALPLALNAIQNCLAQVPAQTITHLIAVSCTGLAAPGLDLMLLRALELAPETARTGVYYLGCYAALHALKQADAICRSDPQARVLLVCAELCTLHFQFDTTPDSLASAMLFADGAAAALIAPQGAGLELCGFASAVDFSGWDEMAWHPSETGFLMRLGHGVPDHLQRHGRPLLEKALAAQGLRRQEVQHWALHPGGRKILDVLAQELELPPQALAASRHVLQNCGNMSSPTVLFVLAQLWAQVQAGEWVCAAAFGPGLSLESAVLRATV
ncbi:MAG: type III polyketide synthase [Candidatus Sericytochromatia bacterium]